MQEYLFVHNIVQKHIPRLRNCSNIGLNQVFSGKVLLYLMEKVRSLSVVSLAVGFSLNGFICNIWGSFYVLES